MSGPVGLPSGGRNPTNAWAGWKAPLDPELVDRGQQLVGSAVDAERAGAEQLVLAIATGQQPDAEHPGASGSEQVPHRVTHHVAIPDRDAKSFLAGQDQVRFRLG